MSTVLEEVAAAAADAATLAGAPSLSPVSGLMYSDSSLAPSSHVIRSRTLDKGKLMHRGSAL